MTSESFDLDGNPTKVRIEAAYSKNRKLSEQPIRPELSDVLRPRLVGKATGSPVFAVPQRTDQMLRHDLEAAGIDYKDKAGRVADFHAFRHTYVSMVVQGGASVKVAQELTRHSTPLLTIGRYAHASLDDQSAALTALPDTLVGPPQPAKKVAGEDRPSDVPVTTVGPNRAPSWGRAGAEASGMWQDGEQN